MTDLAPFIPCQLPEEERASLAKDGAMSLGEGEGKGENFRRYRGRDARVWWARRRELEN